MNINDLSRFVLFLTCTGKDTDFAGMDCEKCVKKLCQLRGLLNEKSMRTECNIREYVRLSPLKAVPLPNNKGQ